MGKPIHAATVNVRNVDWDELEGAIETATGGLAAADDRVGYVRDALVINLMVMEKAGADPAENLAGVCRVIADTCALQDDPWLIFDLCIAKVRARIAWRLANPLETMPTKGSA